MPECSLNMPKYGAYFSLKGAVASVNFDLSDVNEEPKKAGAAIKAAPVVHTFFKKFLLESIIIIS